MEIEIPAIPLGVVTLLGFFSPYAIGALNGALSFVKETWQKRLVSVAFGIVLAGVVIAVYLGFGGALPDGGWAPIGVWTIVVVAASYALVTKNSANRVEARVERNS